MTDLTESAGGSTVTLTVGETRSLALGERPTTGFRWQTHVSDPAVLAVTTAAFRARSLKPGDSGERTFTIVALESGSATVTWTHQRGSGVDALIDRHVTVSFRVK